MAATVPGGLSDAARQLGRHFTVVGALTTLLAVAIPTALIAAGAPTQRPDPSRVLDGLTQVGLATLGAVTLGVVALSLALHPLQFGLTQLLEGYWGVSTWGIRAMERSARRTLERRFELERLSTSASWRVEDADSQVAALDALELEAIERDYYGVGLADAITEARHETYVTSLVDRMERQEADRLLASYPADAADVMPTRLGNVLRRYERLAGEPYGLDAVTVTAYLAQVADPTLREYYDDARSDLDLAVRMVVVWAVVTVGTTALLWRHDVWLLVPIASTLLSILSYRGSVAAAHAYGESLMVLIALGRRNMYAALGVELPPNSSMEALRNERLSQQLEGACAFVVYRRTTP